MHRLSLLVPFALVFACQSPPPPPVAPATTHLGDAIAREVPTVTLGALAKDPSAYQGKPFATAGTVTAVCQEMGCWMEIKDDASQAHIKMAGHGFFVPRTASGRHARVQATLVPRPSETGECEGEAAKQMGHAVSKLQLEATGVELD
jgi:hypothetical protein